MVYASGDVYTGWFENGKRVGFGSLTFKDGGVYVGGWLEDKKHGYGT